MNKINPKNVSASNPDAIKATEARNLADLLPAVNKTELVDKFFSSTINHAFQPEQSENVAGFIGRKVSYYDPDTEFYIPEKSHDRSVYQLAPLAVTTYDDKINHAIFYQDMLNLLRLQGGNDLDHSRLFAEKYYSWSPPINLDKFVNFQNYVWLPPVFDPQIVETVVHFDNFENGNAHGWFFSDLSQAYVDGPDGDFTQFMGRLSGTEDGSQQVRKTFNLNSASSAATISFDFLKIDGWDMNSNPSVTNTNGPEALYVYLNNELAFSFIPNQDVITGSFAISNDVFGNFTATASTPSVDLGFSAYPDRIFKVVIQVSNVNSIVKLGFGTNLNQGENDESLGIDNIEIRQMVPITKVASLDDQDYIVIERGSLDGNPWSKANLWFHIDDLTSEQADIAKNFRAKRPIIEFNKNLELYSYGKNRVASVDIIDDTMIDPSEIVGNDFFTLNGVDLVNGMRIIFTNPNISDSFGWESEPFSAENGGVGQFDASIGATYAENTLTFTNGGGHGIITGGTNFLDHFGAGDRIKISGSNNTKNYFIREIPSATTIIVDEEFDATGVQTNEISIIVTPVLYKNKIFTVTGVGDLIQLVEASSNIVNSELVISATGFNQYANLAFDHTVSVDKSVPDATSTHAPLIYVSSNTHIAEYDIDGQISNGIFEIVADKRNTVNDTLWTVKTVEGDTVFGPFTALALASFNNEFSTTDENSLTLTSDGYASIIDQYQASGLEFIAETSDMISSSTSIYKIKLGDETDIVSFTTKSSHLVPSDHSGNVVSMNDAVGEIKVYVGGVDVSKYFDLSTKDNENRLRVIYNANKFVISGYTDNTIDGDILAVTGGEYAGSEFYWDDSAESWIASQAKDTRNQAPLFMLYDVNGVKLDDIGQYAGSDFKGSKIFSYAESTSAAMPVDTHLDMRLSYDQYGEILFANNLETDKYHYNSNSDEIYGYYFYHNFYENEYNNGWYESPTESSQKLISLFELVVPTREFVLDYAPTDLTVHVNGKETKNYSIAGNVITFDTDLVKNTVVEFKFFTDDPKKRSSITSAELPLNLSANPFNEEVTTISKSDYLEHFMSIINNQDGFVGVSTGSNNFRKLKVNYGAGTSIVQHHNSMAKLLGISSNPNLNIVSAIRYSEREYVRFKNKLINKITSFIASSSYASNTNANEWLYDAIKAINIAKSDQFPFSYNAIIGSYIPATPSRLGLYPVFKPEKYIDYSLREPMMVIQGHDGSITPAFNDFRDDVLIAYEQFIYDSIPQTYKGEESKIYRIMDAVSTRYKPSKYSIDEFNQLLTPIILQWAAKEGIVLEDNTGYEETDPFTYNYSNQGLPGYWRGVISEFYGTDRPNTHPWEMFGFSEEPTWWVNTYGPKPYKFNNPVLWDDMRTGTIRHGSRKGVHHEYARTGLPSPSDNSGRLRDPISLGLASQALKNDQIKNWEIGDLSPGETVFRKSSNWPFAVAIIGYLMEPAKFFTYGWDLNGLQVVYQDGKNPQLIDRFTGKRPGRDLILQSESGYIGNGVQTWLVDYVMSNGQSVVEFTSSARNVDIRIGYKTGGFVNKDTIKLLTDNVQTSIPQENINVFLYQNPSIREVVYSGITITKETNGWSVYGYDILNNQFYAFAPDVYSKKTNNAVGQVTVKTYSNYTDQIIKVPYGTVFQSVQQVYDFIIGYSEWLASQGWTFDHYDVGTKLTDTWEKVANDFALWAQGRWAIGASLSLSPSSTNMRFKTEHGFVDNLNQLINGVYSLIDVSGTVIDQADTFINRDGNEVVIQSSIPIFGARLTVSEIEHVIVLDNKTIFNDLIYSQMLNLYQPRMRLQTTRTLEWVGRINAPGYFVKADTISPNIEKSIADVQKYFDIEKQVDVPVIQEIARRNIGYQSRSYLDQILISPTTQFQFYQGFIRNKGTISTLSTLLRSGISSGSDDVKFYEEWAIKVGDFGNIKNGINAEFLVKPNELKSNVQLFDFSFARLASQLGPYDTDAYVENVDNFPDSGIILIGSEKIRYNSRSSDSLHDLERGILNTEIQDHNQYTQFGLDDNEYDSVITINPSDPRWINKPLIMTDELFNTRPIEGRRFNGEYLLPSDNRVAGYVLPSEVKARYNTLFDFTDALPGLLQDGSLEINDQVWVDRLPSGYTSINKLDNYYSINYEDQFQVFTIRLKGVDIVNIPTGYAGTLRAPLAINDTVIMVSNISNWPDQGIVQIENERIYYSGKTSNSLTGIERGMDRTLVGNVQSNGDLINNGTFPTGTLINVEYSGYGDVTTFELDSNPFQAGDTIILENLFVDYINYSGVYEIIESYGDNIKIDLVTSDDSVINVDDISILDLVESRYYFSRGWIDPADYTLLTFELAEDFNESDQSITLISTKNLKAPGRVKIDEEVFNYKTINGNRLEGVGREVVDGHLPTYSAGTTVTRLKTVYLYMDSEYSSIADTEDARWYVVENVDGKCWDRIRFQDERVETEDFKNLVVYDNDSNFVIAHLQAYDPAKNLFPGQVAAEIDYRLDVDPASYEDDSWGIGQVGQVWWNTDNLVYENYETSDNYYRSINWGKMTPFSTIDVYEWVESLVPPEEWATNADSSDFYAATNGEPFIDSNGVMQYVTAEKVNKNNQNVTVYYFWVKNLSARPPFQHRQYSVFEIANILRDPTSEGIVWFAPSSTSSILIANLNHVALSNNTSIQLSYNNQKNINSAHSQWLLMREGDEMSLPPRGFWDQMKASMSGHNVLYQPVPDMNIEPFNRYGVEKRPRQSWFIDQDKAVKEFFKSVNRLFAMDQIVDRDGFKLLSQDADKPVAYGSIIALSRPIQPCEFSDPLNYSTDKTGADSAFVVDSFLERNTLVDSGMASIGDQILVNESSDTGGFWRIYKVATNVVPATDANFIETCAETHKYTDFWDFADFSAPGFDYNSTQINFTYEHYENIDAGLLVDGDFIKITDFYDDGTNIEVIYQYLNDEFEIVFRQNGTIAFDFEKFADHSYGNNDKRITNMFYPDGIPGRQLAIEEIINILRGSILTNLEVNLVFFSMINQVFSEQLNVDWAFKTTYIVGEGLNQVASQSPVFIANRSNSFIDYVNEAKPYHTKLRDFRINVMVGTDIASMIVTDFDKPVWFDQELNKYRVLDPSNPDDMAIMNSPDSDQYWWSRFYNKDTHEVRTIETTIYFDRVSCQASFGWDSAGFDDHVWDADVPEYMTAADRIVKSYTPLPYDQSDIVNNRVNKNLDLNDLIPGCSFRGTIVDNVTFKDLQSKPMGGWSSIAEGPWSNTPWSPLASGSNIIDIGEYNAIYRGNVSNYRFTRTLNGDGFTSTFSIGSNVSATDEVVVFVNGDETSSYSIDGSNITLFNILDIGDVAKVIVFNEDSFNDPSVEESSDIVLDGYLFKQPYIDSDHPEELVNSSVGESLTIQVQTNGVSDDGKVINKTYTGEIRGPFDIGQEAIVDDSVLVFINGVLQSNDGSVYVISHDRKTLTIRNNVPLAYSDRIDIFSFGIGGNNIVSKYHDIVLADSDRFTVAGLDEYPFPLVIVDGDYRKNFTIDGSDIVFSSIVSSGSTIDVIVFKSTAYTQMEQKNFLFSGSNKFDLNVVLPDVNEALVSLNGIAIANDGDYPDYAIDGQILTIFNKVKGEASNYDGGEIIINNVTVTSSSVDGVVSNVNNIADFIAYIDKNQLVIANVDGEPITVSGAGATSMGMSVGVKTSIMDFNDTVEVYMASNDIASFNVQTANNVLEYAIPHDVMTESQISAYIDGNSVSYTVDTVRNTLTLDENPGANKTLEMNIKFINHIDFGGTNEGEYELGFIPFNADHLMVFMNGVRLKSIVEYTVNGSILSVPSSRKGDEMQVYFYSSRTTNGDGSFIIHYDQMNNKISQDYAATNMFTLGESIDVDSDSFLINKLQRFHYGRLTLVSGQKVEDVYVREPFTVVKKASVSSMKLPNPVSRIEQISVIQQEMKTDGNNNIVYVDGRMLRPYDEYNFSPSDNRISFNEPKSNIKVSVRYIINNVAYNVIRHYDNTMSYDFNIGTAIIQHSGERAKNRLYRAGVKNAHTLAQPLVWGDREIILSDATGLPKQSSKTARMKSPGVIWVNGERIEFWRRDGNVLKQIVRATGGTSAGIADTLTSNYRHQNETFDINNFNVSGYDINVNSSLIDYMNVGDIIFVNNIKVKITGLETSKIIVDTLIPASSELKLTVFKPKPSAIPVGTIVHNGGVEHEYEKGYTWVHSPFGLQFNNVDEMARFINFSYNK